MQFNPYLYHAADGLPRLAQVEEVVVGEVPLPVGRRAVEDGDAAVRQRRQHPALHVTEVGKKSQLQVRPSGRQAYRGQLSATVEP